MKEEEIIEMYERIRENSVPATEAGRLSASILVLAIALSKVEITGSNEVGK